MAAGGAKSTIFNREQLLMKDLNFENGGAKLASCSGRHLTLLHPCLHVHEKFGRHHLISVLICVAFTFFLGIIIINFLNRFLATGDTQTTLAFSYRVGQSTLSNIIMEGCAAIWETLMPRVLKPPCTQDEWRKIAAEFHAMWNFPMCIGALDGKHVMIQAPFHAGSEYYNYKVFHSIVLLALCDAHYCFTMVDIGNSGRHSDGGVFANSEFGKKLLENSLNLPPADSLPTGEVFPYCVVADAAFPLKRNLMRPYPGRSLPPDESIFNYRLSRARRVIENTFGILSNRWRIFKRPIIAHPEKAVAVTKAACCLHNFLQIKNKTLLPEHQYYCLPGFVDQEDRIGNIALGSWRHTVDTSSSLRPLRRVGANTYGREAAVIRDNFKKYFATPHGQVPMQAARAGVLG